MTKPVPNNLVGWSDNMVSAWSCAEVGWFNHYPASTEPERFVMPWQEVPKTRALRAGLENP